MTPKLKTVVIAIACVFATGQGQAIGTDPSVVAGQASFSTQGNTQSISNSPGTIINWQGFSIGAGESAHFNQQSAASSVLNRVIGPDPSVILGMLTSNGRVFLINPSGILFGQGARIDVAGLVASTLNLSNPDFLAGRLNFTPNSLAGKVENQGSITTPSGGSVYLVGSNVTNSGIITSPQGDVILAAGQSVNIYDTSTPGVRVEITAGDNAVVNLGAILAQSGEIGIYGASLRNAGIVNADQVVRDVSGKIVLRAKQDVTLETSSRLSANGEQAGGITVQSETGTTLVSGTIEAISTGSGKTGGTVNVLGVKVGLFDYANINVSGDAGGGAVLVGGDYQGTGAVQHASATYLSADSTITADAITHGIGGKVVLWSNDSTRAYGRITARGGAQSGDGGLIETSGHWLDVAGINVNASAPNGIRGTWLLDPASVTIGTGDVGGSYNALNPDVFSPAFGGVAANVDAGNLQAILNGGTDVTITTTNTGTAGLGLGDITVNAALTWTTAQTLRLLAANDVIVNYAMTATASTALGSGIVLTAGRDVLISTNGGLNTGMTASSQNSKILLTAGRDVTITAPITTSAQSTVINMSAGNNVNANAAVTASGAGSSIVMSATAGNVTSTYAITATGLNATIDLSATGSATGNVNVTTVTADGGGPPVNSVYLRANNNVNVNGSISAAGGLVILRADNDGSGPGVAGGTVNFVAPGAVVASNTTTILFNPNGYANTAAEISAYSLKVTGTLDARAWVFAQATKVYDGLTASSLSLVSDPTAGGIYSVNLTAGTATFDTKNVGTGKIVTVNSGYNLGGGNANMFALFSNAGTVTGSITARALTITASGVNKVYDGGIVATETLADNRIAGDLLTLGLGSASYLDKNVANGKTVNVSGITLTGTDAANYTFNTSAATTANITPAALTVTAAAASKTYDGNTSSVGVPTFGTLQSGDTTTTFAQSFDTRNAGTGKTLTASGIVNDGNSGNNYALTFVTDMTGIIIARALTVSGITAGNKVYDGTPVATVNSSAAVYTGLIGGDAFSVSATGSFADKNAANGKTVTLSSLYSGADVGNYSITSQASTTANITARALTVTATTDSKTYNGTTGSAVAPSITAGALQTGDTTTTFTQTFDTRNAGNAKTLTASGIVNDGNGGNNYALTFVTDTTGVINPLAVTLTAPIVTKTYDGGLTYTTLAGDLTALSSQLVGGDSVSAATIAYANKNAGTGNKAVTLNAATISDGNGGVNYIVTPTGNSTSTITARALTVTAATDSKTYDGNTISVGMPTFGALQTGDTTTTFAQTFDTRNAGISKILTASGIVNDGNSGNNYALTFVTDTTGIIIARALTVSGVSAGNKVYDGTPVATMNSSAAIYTGLILGDAFSVSATGSFADKNATNGKTVTLSSLYSGADVGNYSITNQVSTTANITPALLSIAANNATRLYGDANPAFSVTYTGLQNGESPVVLTGTLAITTPAIPSSNTGSYAITPSGLSSTNYTISPVDGILSVKPVTLIITADTKSKLFGTTDPALSYSVTGLVNHPALGVVDTAGNVLTGSLARTPGESALGGPYVISQNNLAANSNYAINFADSNFIITGVVAEVATVFGTQLVSTGGVINNELYYRPGNFWHISLNPDNADPGFDVIRGTNDLKSRLSRRLNICAALSKGAICETW